MLINIFPSRLKIINTPTFDAKQKDGALQMLGSLADVLLKKKIFKDHPCKYSGPRPIDGPEDHGFQRSRKTIYNFLISLIFLKTS
jgi:hypothetical protein